MHRGCSEPPLQYNCVPGAYRHHVELRTEPAEPHQPSSSPGPASAALQVRSQPPAAAAALCPPTPDLQTPVTASSPARSEG